MSDAEAKPGQTSWRGRAFGGGMPPGDGEAQVAQSPQPGAIAQQL